VINIIESIYNMKTNIAKVKYPETFAKKIRKIFNNDETLYTKALEQVSIILLFDLLKNFTKFRF
jgi:hypothetical protein